MGKECAGYKGAETTAPSMEEMNKQIEEKVIKRTLQSITLKSGQPAISLYGSHTPCTSILPVSSSLVVLRVMLASLAARSSLTPMEVGVPTEVVHSQARTLPRWTGQQPTFAVRWQSLL